MTLTFQTQINVYNWKTADIWKIWIITNNIDVHFMDNGSQRVKYKLFVKVFNLNSLSYSFLGKDLQTFSHT